MMNLENKVTKTAFIFLSSAIIMVASCGKHAQFKGGKTAPGDTNEGANEIVVSEGGAKDPSEGTGAAPGGVGAGTENTAAPIDRTEVGIKNFLQINATFSALTQVPTTNALILTAFNATKTQLPAGNSIKTFSASTQVAIAKLAAAYCDVGLNDAALRGVIVPGFNFTGNVAVALDAAGQENLVNGLMTKFWGDVTSGVDNTASKGMLMTLVTDLRAGLETGPVASVHAIALATCTGALASSPVTFL
jgi:hypothetical protein